MSFILENILTCFAGKFVMHMISNLRNIFYGVCPDDNNNKLNVEIVLYYNVLIKIKQIMIHLNNLIFFNRLS